MVIKVKLQVSASEYFDFIMDQLLKELPKSMRNKMCREDIQLGLKYRQTYNLQKGSFVSKKEIIDFKYGEVYCLQMEIPDGFQYMKHTVTPLSDDAIEVRYEETLDTVKASTNFFHKLKAFSNKKQMKKRFEAIEQYIIENRKEASEPTA